MNSSKKNYSLLWISLSYSTPIALMEVKCECSLLPHLLSLK